MREEIRQIVYASRAARDLPGDELAGILQAARRNNERDAITGMLLFNRGHFLQVLEGPTGQLAALLTKLEGDPRHCDLNILLNGVVASRAFGAWSMAFRDLSGAAPEQFPGYSHFFERGFSSAEGVRYPNKALRLLLAFREPTLTQFKSLAS